MVTASHNPPQDNGYKVYAADGAQIVPPVDAEIEAAVAAVGPLSTVPMSYAYTVLGDEVLESYVDSVASVPRTPHRRIRTVHTALHGVGAAVLRQAFDRAGFEPPVPVAEQAEPDPDFPTVPFPNPRSPARSTSRWRWPSGPAPTCCWPAIRTRTGARSRSRPAPAGGR
jgi:phosphomannomutase